MFDAETKEHPFSVARSNAIERATFIRKTYLHLAFAILGFVALEAYLLHMPGIENLIGSMFSTQFSWLIVLGLFMAVSWVANRWAMSDTSPMMQYAGLILYVVAEAVIFLPILYVATFYSSPDLIPTAGLITLLLFAGLTATAFITKKDFSFLGSILTIGGFIALGVIVASFIFGYTLGLLFSAIMVFFAGAAVLYQTSNIIHRFRPGQHVAASLALFAAVALLFFYVLRVLMASRR